MALFSLRFYNLTILPVFADEAIYIRWSQIMKAEETLRFLPMSDGKQPFFMWATMFPQKLMSDPLLAGRLVSVLSGFGTLVGVTFLSWLLFKNKSAALAAGLIYSVTPFTFFFDRMSMADSMLSMFGVWTFIFSYLAVTKKRLDYAMLAGFSLGAAWLTKSPALFFVIMLPALLIFVKWEKSFKNNLINYLRSFGLLLVTVIIGYGLYNILRLGPNFEMISRRNLDYVYPISHFLTSPLDPLKPFFLQAVQWLLIMGPAVLVILWVYGLILNAHKYPKALFVLTIWFLLPVVIQSEFAKVLTARYILFTIPYFIIATASAFTETRRNWIKVLTVILAFFVAQSLVFDKHLLISPAKANLPRSERSGYLEEWTAGHGIYEASVYLQNYQSKNPGKKIVIGTEGYFGTLPDGLQAYLNRNREITIIGVGLNFTATPTSLIESRESGNATFLLINNDRFKGNAENQGLQLIAEYPKADRPDGTHQSLLFYELK